MAALSWILALILGGLASAPPVSQPSAQPPPAQAQPDPAPAPAPLEPKPARVRASIDEGFGVESHDGAFGLRVGLLTQMRYQADYTAPRGKDMGGLEQGFRLRLARPVLSANLWGNRVRARVMPEFAGSSPRLLDATAVVRVHDAFAVQLGQYRPWISRGRRTGLPVQALPGRGAVVGTFRVDRDIGLTLLGRPFDGRFEYYLGVFNGAGPNVRASASPLLTARVVFAPLGAVAYDQLPYLRHEDFRLALGASAYTVGHEGVEDAAAGTIGPDSRDVGVSGDLVVSGSRVSAQAEGFWRRSAYENAEVVDGWGAYSQLAVLVVRRRLDLAVRAGVIDEGGAAIATDLRWPIEAGFNVYAYGNHAKLQVSYGCDLATGVSGCTTHRAIAQIQLGF